MYTIFLNICSKSIKSYCCFPTAGSYATSPYIYPQLASGYTNQTSTATLGLPSQRMQLSNGPCSVYSADSTSAYCGTVSSSSLYGSQQRSSLTHPVIGMTNLSWPAMPSSTQLLPTTSSLSTIPPPPRPSSHNVPPIHSPLTAQVYSDPLRQTSLDVSDGSYSYQQQHSPDQMLPECASSEPTSECCCINFSNCTTNFPTVKVDHTFFGILNTLELAFTKYFVCSLLSVNVRFYQSSQLFSEVG